MKKVGILGSGIVGQTLGAGFIKKGYEVTIGTREPSKLSEWKAKTGGNVSSFEDATKTAEIIVIATKGAAATSAINLAGIGNFKGKLVLDATNPIDDATPPKNGVLRFFTSLDDSLLERLQKLIPEAHLVKAFSCVGSHFMVDPDFGANKPTMFICGNDDSAKKEATDILTKFGWETEDMGTAEAARAIEPLCILWCIPGLRTNSWAHAFKLLKK